MVRVWAEPALKSITCSERRQGVWREGAPVSVGSQLAEGTWNLRGPAQTQLRWGLI